MKEKLKYPIQFGKTLWGLIGDATRKYNWKNKTDLTKAEYVRRVVARHLTRKGKWLWTKETY